MAPMPRHSRLCCVFGCDSQRATLGQADFFTLPKRKEAAFARWIRAVKLPGRIATDMAVCARHFRQEDFESDEGGRKKLKVDAIPSLRLPLVWRNKFYPRDYGRLVKLLEFRGIGRLRLCYEAKLGRRLWRNSIKPYSINNRNLPQSMHKESSKKSSGAHDMSAPVIRVASTFSLSPNDNSFNNNQLKDGGVILTSEIMIKEEPIFLEEREETVEEMLARMNEDSNEAEALVDKDANDGEINIEGVGSEGSLCYICGDEDCNRHDREGDKFSCDICGKSFFKSLRQLSAHKLCHSEYHKKGLAKKKEIKKVDRLKTLTKNDENPEQHVCMLCDKTFKTKVNLIQHVNSHTITNSFRCRICKECFESLEELDKHARNHKVLKREYKCRECGQKFRSKAACWEHLNSHMRARSKPGLPCDICGRVLSTKATLKEHMFIHSGEKPFECQLCGRKIRHRANFINHVQGHSLGQPHICMTCGMGFPRKAELNSHVSAEHPEDRPFHCIICGMRFRTEARFHKHAVSHDAYLEE
ncbi:zinc finger protein 311-like [Cimex lectularius]|uniref:Zinc finger protein n=1 Tax=Cimex lectularius TaxID=79782 RepID=A0A8I6TD09_CIMLE|nr:zinc finger protein 311-like [Cimex lectularius]